MENLSFGEMFRLEAALDSNVREYVNPETALGNIPLRRYARVAIIVVNGNDLYIYIYSYIVLMMIMIMI